MRRLSHLATVALLAALLAAPVRSAFAGAVTACFAQGRLGVCSERVLQHVGFKSVVLQFIDPDQTRLGEGLARIFWREILESISNVAGAGVILAYDRDGAIREALGGRDYTEFLAQEYHAAAERIARQLDVQISVWGAVLDDGEDLYMQSFLTLHSSTERDWTSLSLGKVGDVEIAAVIGQRRLNLAPLRVSRAELFGRTWTTRCALKAGCPQGIDLRAGPSNDEAVVARVRSGSVLQGSDMVDQWMRVERPDGAGTAYVNVYHLEMFPARVAFGNRANVNFRASAGGERIARVDLNGEYEVLAAVRGPGSEPWYKISVGGREGWVADRLIESRSYVFPAVHLLAGLYRYAKGDRDGAVKELETFLAGADREDNVTRAVARQFLAASRVAGRQAQDGNVDQALADLDQAVKLTPYDPAPYRMRSVVRLGKGRGIEASVTDLGRALALDEKDVTSSRLLDGVIGAMTGPNGLRALAPEENPRETERAILKIGDRYAAPAQKEALKAWEQRNPR